MMKLEFTLKSETKTCYRFERRASGQFETLYLKKETVAEAGIDAKKGITVSIQTHA